MLLFLKAISFFGVSPDSLLAANAETKLQIQSAVQKGIDLGIVKPYGRHVLTGHCTEERAVKTLKYVIRCKLRTIVVRHGRFFIFFKN